MEKGKKKKWIIGLSVLTVSILGGVILLSSKAKAKLAPVTPLPSATKKEGKDTVTPPTNTPAASCSCGVITCTPEQMEEVRVLANAPIACRKSIKFNYGK